MIHATQYANMNIRDDEENVMVPAPDSAHVRIVTFFRFVNHDSNTHTPNIRVRSANPEKVDAEDEYVRTYPERALETDEWMEDRAPVIALNHEEQWVIELAAVPTDLDNPPTVFVMWVDDVSGALRFTPAQQEEVLLRNPPTLPPTTPTV